MKPSRIARLKRQYKAGYNFVFMRPDPKHLAELVQLLEGGAIKPVIDQFFPFDRAIEAFEYLSKGRAIGKVIVDLKSRKTVASHHA